MTRPDDSTEKIHEALALLNEAARDKKNEFKDLLGNKYTDLREVVAGLETDAEQRVRHSMDRAHEVGQDASERVQNTAQRIDRRVHEDPWKTVGWAVVGAFLAGFLVGHKE